MTALYELLDDGRIVYVGVTVEPKNRLAAHKATKPNGSVLTMRVLRWFGCRKQAEFAERKRIKELEPELNIKANEWFWRKKQWAE